MPKQHFAVKSNHISYTDKSKAYNVATKYISRLISFVLSKGKRTDTFSLRT